MEKFIRGSFFGRPESRSFSRKIGSSSLRETDPDRRFWASPQRSFELGFGKRRTQLDVRIEAVLLVDSSSLLLEESDARLMLLLVRADGVKLNVAQIRDRRGLISTEEDRRNRDTSNIKRTIAIVPGEAEGEDE